MTTTAPTSATEWWRTWRVLAVLATVMGVLWFGSPQLHWPDVPYFLIWHQALEVLAIAVSAMIFAVGWNTHSQRPHGRVLALSLGFLAVAVLDFSHSTSFVGMPNYFTPNSVEKGIHFWLAARYAAALTLLVVVLWPFSVWAMPRRVLSVWFFRPLSGLLLLGAGVVLVHVWLLVYPHTIPPTFVEGVGLTPFKLMAECGVIALHVVTAALLWLQRDQKQQFNTPMLFGAVCVMAMSEVFFTLYLRATDVFNLTGHLYKVVAYWLLYQAVYVTAVTQPYRALNTSRQYLQAILNAVPDVVFEVNAQGRYCNVYAPRPKLLAAPVAQLLGRTVHDMLPPAAAAEVMAALDEAREHGHSYGRILEVPLRVGLRWFELSVTRKGHDERQGEQFVVLSRDITQRTTDQVALRRLGMAVEQNPNAIVITDPDARIEYVNPAFVTCTGYSAAEVQGCNPRLLASGQTPPEVYQAMWAEITAGRSWRGELINRRKNGDIYVEDALIFPIANEQGQTINYLAIKEDITERKRAAARIEQLAHFDALTGLPNRTFFATRLQQVLALAQHAHSCVALLHLDLDNFKHINESLGHKVGNELLQAVAQRLKDWLPDEDLLCRHSSDEFMVVLPLLREPQAAAHTTKELQQALQAPFRLANAYDLVVTSSVGIALYPDDGADFDTLAQCAESALHRAKSEGRDTYRFFAPGTQQRATRVLQLENALRAALPQEQLQVYYQPQIRAHDQQLVGFEALVRWRHPEWGMVSPGDFIPVAESSGQIIAIGAWVLRTAALQARRWLDAGHSSLTVAVNLSMAQFRHPGLVQLVQDVLNDTGLPPEWLELELTESMAMDRPANVTEVVGRLHALGVSLSIDDFGTGYSSLSYLKRLRVQKLKIDQSFVRNIATDANDASIVNAIINMAHSLGTFTVAEGVETPEQFDMLCRLGCDEMQGYLFSPALPVPELERRLEQGFVRTPAAFPLALRDNSGS